MNIFLNLTKVYTKLAVKYKYFFYYRYICKKQMLWA
jgi:hypothetical protein